MVYVTDGSDIDMRFSSFKFLFAIFILLNKFKTMELLSRLELPNLLITNEVLYRLSYSSAHELCYYILHPLSIILQEVEHFLQHFLTAVSTLDPTLHRELFSPEHRGSIRRISSAPSHRKTSSDGHSPKKMRPNIIAAEGSPPAVIMETLPTSIRLIDQV